MRMEKGMGCNYKKKKLIMISPFSNKHKICTAHTPDYIYLWLLIHEPRDKLLWREEKSVFAG